MTIIVLFTVFFAVLLLVLGVYTFASRERLAAAEATRDRLRAMQTGITEPLHIVRERHRSAVPLLDLLLRDQPLAARMEWQLARAGLTWSVGEFILGSLLCAVMMLVGLQWLGLWVAGIGMVFGVTIPWWIVRHARQTRESKMEVQLPDAVDMIVNSMRAGFSLQASMQAVGQEMPAPLGSEFFRFSEEQRLGVDARAALLDLEERIGSLDAKMFVTSLLIQRETGGNLAEVLTGLANLIRERVALRDHIKTLTAEPSATAIILSVLPIFVLIAMLFLNPTFVQPLFVTQAGWFILAFVVAAVSAGYAILRRMAHIEM